MVCVCVCARYWRACVRSDCDHKPVCVDFIYQKFVMRRDLTLLCMDIFVFPLCVCVDWKKRAVFECTATVRVCIVCACTPLRIVYVHMWTEYARLSYVSLDRCRTHSAMHTIHRHTTFAVVTVFGERAGLTCFRSVIFFHITLFPSSPSSSSFLYSCAAVVVAQQQQHEQTLNGAQFKSVTFDTQHIRISKYLLCKHWLN